MNVAQMATNITFKKKQIAIAYRLRFIKKSNK